MSRRSPVDGPASGSTLLTDKQPAGPEAAKQPMNDRWTEPPAGFDYILFERINPANNEDRFYYLGWQQDLLGEWAMVRVYGQRGSRQQVRITPFPSLVQAWPVIRSHIRTRLRHGYRIARLEAAAGLAEDDVCEAASAYKESADLRPGAL